MSWPKRARAKWLPVALGLLGLALAGASWAQGPYPPGPPPYGQAPGPYQQAPYPYPYPPQGPAAPPQAWGQYPPAQAPAPEETPASVRRALHLGAETARVTSLHPRSLAPLASNLLENFEPRLAAAPGGSLELDINGPVIVEEPPFSDLTLVNNPQFGATLAGQVDRALPNLTENELAARQRRILAMISQAGVGIARDFQSYDTRRWMVEPAPGQFDYGRSDKAVRDAADLHIIFIGRLGLHMGGPGAPEGPPADEQAYLRYIASAVRHYAGRINVWSTLKEPEPGPRNRPGNDPGLNPEDVVRVLQLSYQAIKATNPRAVVYFPGLGPLRNSSYTAEDYLERIIALGGARYFDVLGYDAYVSDIVESARKCRELLSKYGYDKPIWAAQAGAPDRPLNLPMRLMGGGSPRAQSEFMVKAYVRAFHEGVAKVFWGEFIDRSRGEAAYRPHPIDANGLFYSGTWEVKPAYHTHRLLAAVLDRFQGVEELDDNLYKFTFARRGPVYVLWP